MAPRRVPHRQDKALTYATAISLVNRRALLSLAPAALAGCIGSGVRVPDRPRGPPNFLASFEWLPERSAYRVTFDRGNAVRAENSARVSVLPDPGKPVQWVGEDDATATFPLEPGASIVVPAPEPGQVRVIWEGPEDGGTQFSAALDEWSVPDGGDS
jgi:hypothetical protein